MKTDTQSRKHSDTKNGKYSNGPLPLESEQANDTRQTISGMISTVDKWIHNTTRPVYPLTVTEQMIMDFESHIGVPGIGKKMIRAGFWRLAPANQHIVVEV